MSDKPLNFWQRRQPRERWLLVLCLISAIAAGLYIAREQAIAWQQRAANHLQQRQLESQQIQQLENRMQAVLARQPEKNPGLEQLNKLLPPGVSAVATVTRYLGGCQGGCLAGAFAERAGETGAALRAAAIAVADGTERPPAASGAYGT
ncbi:hypothetical protein [Erwinia amylovora]|uniref:hypothetical protein n=1 Tax=Erwinia amylovora TaxID=552 RepID=UPI001D08DACC|nr:hypothetical protein [Erwinia amylovora]